MLWEVLVSYPMVEALYDYKEGLCDSFTGCYIPFNELSNYKHLSGKDNPNASIHFKIEEWKIVIRVFVVRLQCLLSVDKIDFAWYRENVSSKIIYQQEKELSKKKQKVFVLSAFPEFLLDYFKIDFWNSMVKHSNQKYNTCCKIYV